MMATFNDVENKILDWIFNITGREIILAHDGQGFKQRNPYALVWLKTYNVPNFQKRTLSTDGLTETIKTWTQVKVDLSLYGGNALQDASLLSHSLYSAKRYQDLYKIMGLGSVSDLNDLTALETGAMKTRIDMTVTFNTELEDSFTSDYFESIDVTINEETKPYSETIHVDSNP